MLKREREEAGPPETSLLKCGNLAAGLNRGILFFEMTIPNHFQCIFIAISSRRGIYSLVLLPTQLAMPCCGSDYMYVRTFHEKLPTVAVKKLSTTLTIPRRRRL